MERYVCIHGHFYQPPRENPWLEAIEYQESAYPYQNWNERISAECYAPNAFSRVVDGQNKITEIGNNYSKISFNIGPTLLSWMQENDPEAYQAILDADKESRERFSDHGSAISQAYNHLILPLANSRDKETQVRWGIRDFNHRFGRNPEGMWLPETAVNLETLEVLAQHGISFTILAPQQAKRVRPLGGSQWQDVSGSRIDPTMPYSLNLPSGKAIAIFFYDGPISRAVAFEKLLNSGESFARRLMDGYSSESNRSQIVHIATDGESYGHHHLFGDMALAYALRYIETHDDIHLTNYGEYLEKNQPASEVEIFENTSWSCSHGIERWRSDCGCSSGGHQGWNQAWRGPLRNALDFLRDSLAIKYQQAGSQLFKDPWEARNDYISVILDRSIENIDSFLNRHALRPLNVSEKTTCLKLLELERHTLLMYTSCGWFFDDISGIETVQVIKYAGRVIQLAREVLSEDLEEGFLTSLEKCVSNIPEQGNGRKIYDTCVKPAMVDLIKVGAHYAVSSLFEEYTEHQRIYCYDIGVEDRQSVEAGRVKLVVGKAQVFSTITLESARLSFAVLHFGDHNLNAGVREYQGEEAYKTMLEEVTRAFEASEHTPVIRLFARHFGDSNYSLKSLFKDEQRKILDKVLESTIKEIQEDYRRLHERNYSLMRFLIDLGNPVPKAFHAPVEIVLNANLLTALTSDPPDLDAINSQMEEAVNWKVDLDMQGLGYLFTQTMERMITRFTSDMQDLSLLKQMIEIANITRLKPFEMNLWKVQNHFYKILQGSYGDFKTRAESGDKAAQEWVGSFKALGELLSINVK